MSVGDEFRNQLRRAADSLVAFCSSDEDEDELLGLHDTLLCLFEEALDEATDQAYEDGFSVGSSEGYDAGYEDACEAQKTNCE